MAELNNNGNNKKNGNVRWQVFVWAIGIVLLLFSVAFGIIGSTNSGLNKIIDGNKVDIKANAKDINNIKVSIAETAVSLKNIEQTLLEIKTNLNKNK